MLIRKNGHASKYPCCAISTPEIKENLPLQELMKLLGTSTRSNVLDGYKPVASVILPGKRQCKTILRERAHLVVFRLHRSAKPGEMPKPVEHAKRILLVDNETGMLDVESSVVAAQALIQEIDKKVADKEADEADKAIIKLSYTRAQRLQPPAGGDAASGGDAADDDDDSVGAESLFETASARPISFK